MTNLKNPPKFGNSYSVTTFSVIQQWDFGLKSRYMLDPSCVTKYQKWLKVSSLRMFSDDGHPDRESECHGHGCVILHSDDRRWRGGRHSYVTWQHPSRCPLSRDMSCMSRDKPYDMFICRFWLTRLPAWWFLHTSTFNILLMTLERYAAVMYPIWYKTNVRTVVYYYTANALCR